MSWSSMAQRCSDLGGHLPVFYSRSELEELLALLTTRGDLPVLEAIYIGLQHHVFSRVCGNILFTKYFQIKTCVIKVQSPADNWSTHFWCVLHCGVVPVQYCQVSEYQIKLCCWLQIMRVDTIKIVLTANKSNNSDCVFEVWCPFVYSHKYFKTNNQLIVRKIYSRYLVPISGFQVDN